jgi:hypothetical protein
MAVRGCSGKVYVSATSGTPAEVAEVTEWSFETTSENLDASYMGACTKTFVGGPSETQVQLTCNWAQNPVASADAEQVLLAAAGTNVKLVLYPAGTTAGYRKYTADSALITSVRIGAQVNGFVTASMGLFVNGAMTAGTAT